MTQKKKIIHILADEPTGGVGTFLKETLTADFNYMIIEHIRDDNSSFNQDMRNRAVDIIGFPSHKKGLAYSRQTKSFYQQYAHEIAAIHVHSTAVAIPHLYFAKKYGISCRIMHIHSPYYLGLPRLKEYRNRLLMNLIFSLANQIATCGPMVASSMGLEDKATVLMNSFHVANYPFDVEKRKAIRQQWHLEDKLVLSCVGRYSLPKNQPYLISMMKEVSKKRPDAVLLLVGEGEDRASLEQAIAEANLQEKIILTGNQSDILSWYCASDILVAPSLWEGFSFAVLEAQATGLPCLLSERIDLELKVLDSVTYIPLADTDSWERAIVSSQPASLEERYQANNKVGALFDAKIGQERLKDFYKRLGLGSSQT